MDGHDDVLLVEQAHVADESSSSARHFPCTVVSAVFAAVLCFASLLSFVVLVVFLSWSNEYRNVDEAINDYYDINPWVSFTALLGAIAAILCALCLALAVWHIVKWCRLARKGVDPSETHVQKWVFGKGGFIALAFWILALLVILGCSLYLALSYKIYATFQGLFQLFVVQTLPLAQPVLLLAALGVLALLMWFAFKVYRRIVRHHESKIWLVFLAALGVIWLGLFLFLLCIPVLVVGSSPHIVVEGAPLPPKPRFIAHRFGASLGPENTIEALNKTIRLAKEILPPGFLFAVETDVWFSKDQVPFLLHDTTFRRTSDIGTRLGPNYTFAVPGRLFWNQIAQLDVGSWFVDSNPFGTIGSKYLSREEAESYRGARVPTLLQTLELIKQWPDLKIMWDLRADVNQTKIVLQMINQTGTASQVLWLVDINNNETMKNIALYAPTMDAVMASEPRTARQKFLTSNLNFRYYNKALETDPSYLRYLQRNYNLSGIIYTPDERWLYDTLWLYGTAFAVTTNAFQNFYFIDTPVWTMTTTSYTILWVVSNVVSLIIFGIMCFGFSKVMLEEHRAAHI